MVFVFRNLSQSLSHLILVWESNKQEVLNKTWLRKHFIVKEMHRTKGP